MLNVILMTDDDPVDSWVAYQLAQQFPIAHSLLLDFDSPDPNARSLGERLSTDPFRVLSAIPREIIRQRLEGQREQVMEEQLWGGQRPALAEALPNVIKVVPEEINSEATAEMLRRLKPDLLMVCGGLILDQSIYSIPRLGSWNLHWGISDRYRGQHCIFFPLAAQAFDAIGATVHRIDSGINQGEVLFQLSPALEPGDSELSLEIRIARRMVPALVELLTEVQALPSTSQVLGQLPQRAGQLVYYRDRGAMQEIKHQLQHKLGLSSVPQRAEQQQRFLRFSQSSQLAELP